MNIEKPYYKAIILIIASTDNQYYINARNIWKKYMYTEPTIKVIFVYEKLHTPLLDYCEDDDLIFEHIEYRFPLSAEKSIEAMKIIEQKYNYDFLIRTNISTFWDFHKLKTNLDSLPKEKCYAGYPLSVKQNNNIDDFDYYPCDINYVSGTDIVLSSDLVNMLINPNQLQYYMYHDVCIGYFLNTQNNIPIISLKWVWLDSPNSPFLYYCKDIYQLEDIPKIYNDPKVDHYRVKYTYDREVNDFNTSKLLLKTIYNIDYA